MHSDPHDLVVLSNVTFGYGERPVLESLNVRIARGKVTALMGASGGGKTTVLRLIGGQQKAQSGQVLFDGQDVGAMDDAQLYAMRRRMGMLFQFGALFTDMSVFDNVAFPLREHLRLPEPLVRDIVLMKLNAVGLRGARDLMPAEVSGGMARRVALARAIALDPELVMYDEPFAGLDHVVILADGGVAAQGTPAEVRASEDPLVQQFIHVRAEGPVRFEYPGPTVEQDFGVAP
jgi:phospholipid/cholesterol/gamma-HCH transport system ATP-binding protein